MTRRPDLALARRTATVTDGATLLGRCLDVYHATREAHPDLLHGALTWNGALGLCRRLAIDVLIRPLVREAQVVAPLGTPIIMLNSNVPPRRHVWRLAHELGHVLMGHTDGRGEVVHHLSPCEPDDPREDEAENLATLLCQGPHFAAIWDEYRGAGRSVGRRVSASRHATPPRDD